MEKNTKVLFLSFLIFIISISTVLISYFISLKYNFIEACIPNIDGCFSISRVGRNPPAIYLFKTGLSIVALLIFYFFWLLRTKNKYSEVFYVFSILACFFLLLYTSHFFCMYLVHGDLQPGLKESCTTMAICAGR